jgi:hypothetical protein
VENEVFSLLQCSQAGATQLLAIAATLLCRFCACCHTAVVVARSSWSWQCLEAVLDDIEPKPSTFSFFSPSCSLPTDSAHRRNSSRSPNHCSIAHILNFVSSLRTHPNHLHHLVPPKLPARDVPVVATFAITTELEHLTVASEPCCSSLPPDPYSELPILS